MESIPIFQLTKPAKCSAREWIQFLLTLHSVQLLSWSLHCKSERKFAHFTEINTFTITQIEKKKIICFSWKSNFQKKQHDFYLAKNWFLLLNHMFTAREKSRTLWFCWFWSEKTKQHKNIFRPFDVKGKESIFLVLCCCFPGFRLGTTMFLLNTSADKKKLCFEVTSY